MTQNDIDQKLLELFGSEKKYYEELARIRREADNHKHNKEGKGGQS